MKIADALLIQRDIARKVSELEKRISRESWEYRTTEADAKWFPTFNVSEATAEVEKLRKLARKLSRAVSLANNTLDLPTIKDAEFTEWL